MNRKAIITFVLDYKSEPISDFILSCQRVCPDADLFIYVNKNCLELERVCTSFNNVKLIRYQESIFPKMFGRWVMQSDFGSKSVAQLIQNLYQWTGRTKGLEVWLAPLLQLRLKRLMMMRELMEIDSHDQIMLVDNLHGKLVANPFEKLSRNMIVTGKESVSTKELESNRNCYETIYSFKELTKIENRPQLSADVIVGFRHAFGQYLRETIEEIFQNISKIVQMPGAEQAIHTRLFYKRLHGIDKRVISQGELIVANAAAPL